MSYHFQKVCGAVCLLTIALFAVVPLKAAERPHIILIEVDDLTATYTSVWGSKTSPTPTLQRLAKRGFVFDQAMCQGAMCGPSRNCLITGKYPHQLGFYQNGDLRKLPQDAWIFPKQMQRAGYTTAWIGKSHLKPFFANRKEKLGDNFNEFFGFDHSLHTLGRGLVGDDEGEAGEKSGPNPYIDFLQQAGLHDRFVADAEAGRNSTLPEEAYLDGWFTQHTVDYLAKYDSPQPLFLWVNFSVPHSPYDVAAPYHSPFADITMPGISRPKNFEHPVSLISRTRTYSNEKKAIEDQRGFHANIAFMDHCVNQILESLQAKGLLDNSWIVFFSDHGVMHGAQGLMHKSTLFRQVTQPSLIIQPPQGIAGGKRISQPVELMDLLPTFLEVAGAKDSPSPAGRSLQPVFQGQSLARKHTFAEIEGWVVVSDGQYRLIHSLRGEGDFLFDDHADPENLTNIASQRPQTVHELNQAIDAWLKETGEILPPKSL